MGRWWPLLSLNQMVKWLGTNGVGYDGVWQPKPAAEESISQLQREHKVIMRFICQKKEFNRDVNFEGFNGDFLHNMLSMFIWKTINKMYL